jgi:hypothetical protein
MSGPSGGKPVDDTNRGVLNRMINNRAVAKEVSEGKFRQEIDYSKGMPGLVALVRNTLKNKINSVEFRESFLYSLDSNKELREKISTFFYTYQWHFKVSFEEDVRLAIEEGSLSKDIRSRLPNLFPEIAEKEKRVKQLAIARQQYEKILQQKGQLSAVELFYAWVLHNWNYLCEKSYTHKARPPQNGLFFYEPETPIASMGDLSKYLLELYKEFRVSLYRIREYGGTELGGSATVPTIMYQQLMRWIALDSQTSIRGKRLSTYKEYKLLETFPENLKELARRIDANRFSKPENGKRIEWRKEEIWQEIEHHLKDYNIPRVQN